MYLDCHTEILINRNTTLRNLNTDIRKVRHDTGQFRTYCSTSWKGERLRTPDCSKWRNSWFFTNSLCKWEKPPGNCWRFCMKIKIMVEITLQRRKFATKWWLRKNYIKVTKMHCRLHETFMQQLNVLLGCNYR